MIAIQTATPDHLPDIIEAAARQGWNPGLSARMYAGGDPRLPISRIFGITSFELG